MATTIVEKPKAAVTADNTVLINLKSISGNGQINRKGLNL